MSIYPVPLCPKCSAKLVLRLAKKGVNSGNEFWGCPKYPKCNGTLDLTKEQKLLRKQHLEKTIVNSMNDKKSDLPPPIPEKRTELTEKQKKELSQLRDRLLNLSSRNRSVKLNKLDAKWTFDLSLLNPFNENLANELIEFCLKKEGEIGILPKVKNEKDAEYLQKLFTRLKHLEKSVDEIQREKGLYDLYIGFPFLTGIPKGTGTVIQAPIFLIPVKLERKSPLKGQIKWVLSVTKDNPPVFNKTLFLTLSKLCNLKVNQSLFDEEIPDELYGNETMVQKVHELLNEYGIINHVAEDANDTVFDKVIEFKNDDIGTLFQDGKLELRQNAVLGHFPQSNSSIQKDYDSFLSMSQEELEGVVSFLEEYDHDTEDKKNVSREIGEDTIENLRTIDHRSEKSNFFLLPSDSSQDKILLELENSKNKGVVVWGPPGTGKSQTIVNIIGDCLAKNKTVLLVSQKRAALDVVFDRIGNKGMDNLLGLVHDTKEDRKELYKKLSQEISELKSAIGKQKKLLTDPSIEIESITGQLKDISKAYSDDQFGISLGELYRLQGGNSKSNELILDESWKNSTVDEISAAAMQISTLQGHGSVLSKTKYDDFRKPFIQTYRQDIESFSKLLNEILEGNLYKEASFIQINRDDSLVVKTERMNDFIFSFKEYSQYTNPLKFFSPRWWALRKNIKNHYTFSISYLEELAFKSSDLFKRILHPPLVESIVKEIKEGKFNDLEIISFNSFILNQFDQIKGFDHDFNKLQSSLRKIIVELDKLTSDGKISPDENWGNYFRNAVYSLWIKELESKHPIITQIRSGRVEALRLRLNELLEMKIEYSVQKLKEQYRDIQNVKFLRDVENDINKQRNVPSLRKLNEKFVESEEYRLLLPVWLSSPESVSDMFPLKKGMFDVVIFDEASQCTVEHGLPAIFRGKQIVIAGDEKQLPPSHFFEAATMDEDEDDDSFATIEPSLLTLAKKNLHFQSQMLEWHYRSKHQELISFSNQQFYEGRMKVAPNVIPFKKGNKPAIEWIQTEGFWSNRCNELEANEVVRRFRHNLEITNTPTIGIITFNLMQKELIEEKIENLEVNDPEFAALLDKDKNRTDEKGKQLDRRYFVKNIENVQGDERDVIIFSIGYARTEPGGRVYQRFGPIGTAGGENRLNVAVTRAIQKIEIVCSINPETDLDTSLAKNPGPKILKNYLCFAKAVANEDFEKVDRILKEINPNLKSQGNTGKLIFDSPFEEEVYEELRKHGYEIHTQVGQSGFRIDQAVVHPNNKDRYILGIECDGAMFHSGVSIRERDVFRQRFLESRGWVIHRIWSTNWWHDKRKEIDRVLQLLRSLANKK
ncbi:MAG: AAA domain-containing protein [Bacteriovoracaceae bacterium]